MAGSRGLLLPGLSLAVCLLAPIAIPALTLPDVYLPLDREGVFAVFLLRAYLVLALLAWGHRHRRRESLALLLLTMPLVVFGVWLLAADASGYRTALAESPRGPDCMRHRYQRMELFIVPALQWLPCLVIGVVLAIDAWRRRLRESNLAEKN